MREPTWERGSQALFSPRHFFLQRCKKVTGELTTEKMLSVWVSVDCGSKWHFLPGTFFENIKCAWERADAIMGTYCKCLFHGN